jgi:orotate phosphoribosyltransferase
MDDVRQRTIELLIRHKALRFGDFILKSGRKTPYFINIGDIADGKGLSTLGGLLAEKIVSDIGVESFDVLFGPAYKGIALAAQTAASLFRNHAVIRGFCYDRKEMKTHGEGGNFVGADLVKTKGRVLIVDDVITDGATKIETIEKIHGETAGSVIGILTVVDRLEKDAEGTPFSITIERDTGISIYSMITLLDIIDFVSAHDPKTIGIADEPARELVGLKEKI